MNFITFIAFAVGVTVGGLSCALLAQREWRKIRREHAKLINIQDTHYATTNMVSRNALRKLESGDVGGAKEELIGAIAIFHQHFPPLGEDSWIAGEIRDIELHAKSSPLL